MGEPPCFNRPIEDAVVYLGLGSNLGDRKANLRAALERIHDLGRIDAVSRIYESAAVGYREQGAFYNLVVRLTTGLSPEALLAGARNIEVAMGRTRTFRNAPRIIDIDILTYGDMVLRTPELQVPHPRMLERAFVLLPLAEVAPEFVHPVTGQDMSRLIETAATMEPAVPVGFAETTDRTE